MPYVSKNDREKYNAVTLTIDLLPEIVTKGDLEFLIFKLMKKYMATREARYSTLHDTVYATAHASDEFRRRFLDKREDEAMNSNGDIV